MAPDRRASRALLDLNGQECPFPHECSVPHEFRSHSSDRSHKQEWQAAVIADRSLGLTFDSSQGWREWFEGGGLTDAQDHATVDFSLLHPVEDIVDGAEW